MNNKNISSPTAKPRIKIDLINGAVSLFYQIDTADLIGKSRDHDCLRARRVAWYLAHYLSSKNYSQVGMIYRRDHSTIMDGINNLLTDMKTDHRLCAEIGILKDLLTLMAARGVKFLKTKSRPVIASEAKQSQSDRIEKKLDRLTKIVESWN